MGTEKTETQKEVKSITTRNKSKGAELIKDTINVEYAIETYKKQLDLLGIVYPNDASLETLVALRKAFEEISKVTKEVVSDNTGQRTVNDMEDRVRIRLICNNPAKRAHKGEFFGVGNEFGYIRSFIPYNCSAADDMIIPKGFLGVLEHREFLHVRELTDKERRDTGSAVQHITSYAKEFTIIELPMDR